MTDPLKEKIKAYVKERDQVLLSGDIDKMYALIKKYQPKYAPKTRAVTEIAMHKAITAAGSLPFEYRLKSKKWLIDHKCHSLDDGELGKA